MRMPDGTTIPLKVRSLVGLLPLCAATVLRRRTPSTRPGGRARDGLHRALRRRRALAWPTCRARTARAGGSCRWSTRRSCARSSTVMLDEAEFLGPHGIRSISRRHLDQPYPFDCDGQHYEVALSAGRVRHRDVRRQLELARPGLVPDEPRDHARAVAPASLLRRRLQGRVPDRLGTGCWTCARCRSRSASGCRAPSCVDERRAPAGLRRDREVPDRPALARPDPVPRVLPRRQRRRARREPPDRAGPGTVAILLALAA